MTNNQDTRYKQIPSSKWLDRLAVPAIPRKIEGFQIPKLVIGHWSLVIIWLLVISHWSFADTQYLRDVPEGHYAYDAVYDLIRRGVTGGYPDGTFRGKKLISRYEIAAFISKLARSLSRKRGRDEKLIEELKSEVSLIKHRSEKEKRETQVSGDFQARWRVGRSGNLRGGRADYRLRTWLIRNFSSTASLKIDLDTMDAGFGGSERSFVPEMLDVEGRLELGGVELKATSGPNEIIHYDNLFPAENKFVYLRPERSVSISLSSEKTDFSLAYSIHNTEVSGKIDISEVTATLSQAFSPFKVAITPTYFGSAEGERDLRLKLEGEIDHPGFGLKVLLGAAKNQDFPHGLYVGGDLTVGDALHLRVQKIGSQYREKFGHSILDLFDRAIHDGYTSAGLELRKNFNRTWFVKLKGDSTNPGSILTLEVRLGYNLTDKLISELIYQNYQDGKVSESLGMGVTGKL